MSKVSKVVFIGDGATGKTSVTTRLMTDKRFPTFKCVPTLGVEVHAIELPNTNVVNVWDCGGVEKYRGLGDGYYICADAAVIFHTPNDTTKWKRDFRRVCEKPVIHVGARADELTNDEREALTRKYPKILFVSSKSGEGIEKMVKILEQI